MTKKELVIKRVQELGFLKVLAGRVMDINIIKEEVDRLDGLLITYNSGEIDLSIEVYSNYLDRLQDLRETLHHQYKEVQLLLATLEDIESEETELVLEYILNPGTTIYSLSKLYGKKWETVKRILDRYNVALGDIYGGMDIHKLKDEVKNISSVQCDNVK